MIYLDNAATTKPVESIEKIILLYMTERWYNPSSKYKGGMIVKKDIEDVRKNIANFISANTSEIYFTSGATESNNWCIRGFDDVSSNTESVIITTPIEHKSIIEAVKNPYLHSHILFCEVNNNGLVILENLKKLLEENKNKKILVSIGFANSEIGTVQDINSISKLVHKYNAILHVDATQAIPYIPIDVNKMGIDLMSVSAQKFRGVKGTGFLYKKSNIELAPLIYGSQEKSLRGGTENVVGIISMNVALKYIDYNNNLKIKTFRDVFISELEVVGCKLNGSSINRLPNNINVILPQNISGESLLYLLDLNDIFISTGSACNSYSQSVSYVLKSIGLTDDEAQRTIRITLPDDITENDMNYCIKEIKKAIQLLD